MASAENHSAEPATLSPLSGRLRKRQRQGLRLAKAFDTDAYRLFDRDLPGYHFAVDRYGACALVAEYPWKTFDSSGGDALHAARRDELLAALESECDLAPADLVLSTHVRQRPERLGAAHPAAARGRRLIVHEGPLRFEVGLGTHLDVGLFLDQRTTRRWLRERMAGKRLLNLFCYTGAFTVAAAVGGARSSLSVDLSERYLAWTGTNLALNQVAGPQHVLQASDATELVRQPPPAELFDLIVLDPPPASASKRARRFEIQRDHAKLVSALQSWLAPRGALLFVSNLGGFHLDPEVGKCFAQVRELTPASLPDDFRSRPTHRAWLLGDPWLAAKR